MKTLRYQGEMISFLNSDDSLHMYLVALVTLDFYETLEGQSAARYLQNQAPNLLYIVSK